VVQAKEELDARVVGLERRLDGALRLRLTRVRARVAAVTSHRVFEAERGRIRANAQRTDELARRSQAGLARQVERARHHLRRGSERLEAFRWDRQLAERRGRVRQWRDRLLTLAHAGLEPRRAAVGRAAGKLESLSPLAVLSRGYALVWDAAEGRLLRQPADVRPGAELRIRLHGGVLAARVTPEEGE
jgi:exodeoxyribonuclease VII large subunit